MILIGEKNKLEILRFTSVGAYLGDDEDNDILLPNKYLTEEMEVGQFVDVFVYNDSEDRPVATTEIPLININEFALLSVKSATNIGAFLDWGLEKDLFVPFKEQGAKMAEGGRYLVYMYLDQQTNRLVASAKTNKFIQPATPEDFEIGDKVEALVYGNSDLGLKVIVNQKYQGLIFNNMISKPINIGEIIEAYVFYIRTDGKLDIVLEPVGVEKFDQHQEIVLDYMAKNNNRMFLHDKSEPDEIRNMLGMSKKSFKKAIGGLYKAKKIEIFEDKIELK